MKHQISAIAMAALLALAGCNKKSENPPPSPGSSVPPVAGSAAPAAGSAAPAAGSAAPAAGSAAPAAGSAAPAAGSGSAAAAAVDVPTEQDFEDEAKTKITEKNVEAEVGALEKQLDPTKDPAK